MYPQPYLDYLVQFHAERDYFECHEILEEYWKSFPSERRNPVWVGLIQIAVALYHQRRGNQGGADKMLTSAIRLLKQRELDIQQLGLDSAALIDLLEKRLEEIKAKVAYHSLTLPIQDEALRKAYEHACAQRKAPTHRESDMNDHYLLNKHTLRDRSEVFAERQRQIDLRKERREQRDH
ncbi:DUF309 domain-containing protein [Brevibacillus choshinensis]|uniref:DUF309 domain-containing protein n=1 Tax=Brevibacillus choshinensis TaxID=54911 RepID=A0ABX7FK25_BRECH|nr:DUF309 domain-containing protein [Brevibacillus choshinensis]QRG65676.1 DUF309 domain-containing protein [Brevibacillus choshinensis]